MTLPFPTDEIWCLSAGASHQALAGSATDAYSDIFRPPLCPVLKEIQFTQHFRLNNYYLYKREKR